MVVWCWWQNCEHALAIGFIYHDAALSLLNFLQDRRFGEVSITFVTCFDRLSNLKFNYNLSPTGHAELCR